jgi:formamidopyrimidine-DNA glycosylase
MPERPDLEYQVPILARELVGRRITGLRLVKPPVLRVAIAGDPAALIAGHAITAVQRRGGFVAVALDPPDLALAIHPMLAGRFQLTEGDAKSPADLAVDFPLDDGRLWRFRDDRQMGKVYLYTPGDEAKIPGLGKIGLDVLDPAVFTRAAFRALASKRRDQLKSFLLDHAAIDHLGNAYADESMWAAKLHPKARVKELSPAQVDALHDAIADVVAKATAEIASRKPALDEKLRDFLAVRGKKGQPCPRCGTPIRTCGLHGHDAFFCPTCQPDVKGRGFVDWRKLG